MLLGFRCVTICRFSGEPFMRNTVKLGHWAVHSLIVILHTVTLYTSFMYNITFLNY